MTGLLIKDWKLFKNQGKAFFLIVAIAVMFMVMGTLKYTNMVVSYMVFVFGMFSLSSFTYDEYDNGMSYLLSLPVDRKTYIREKYVFGLCLAFGSWIVSIAIQTTFVIIMRQGTDWAEFFCTNMLYLVMVLIFLGYSFPLIIKYGSEKGRSFSFLILTVLVVILYAIEQVGGDRWSLFSLIDQLGRTSMEIPWTFMGWAIAAGLAVEAASYAVSLRLMEKKEF